MNENIVFGMWLTQNSICCLRPMGIFSKMALRSVAGGDELLNKVIVFVFFVQKKCALTEVITWQSMG